jgi:hypothetical protein
VSQLSQVSLQQGTALGTEEPEASSAAVYALFRPERLPLAGLGVFELSDTMYVARDKERAVGLLFALDEALQECLITVDLDRVGEGWRATVEGLTYPYSDRPSRSLGAATGTTFSVEAKRGRRKRR